MVKVKITDRAKEKLRKAKAMGIKKVKLRRKVRKSKRFNFGKFV